MNLFHWRQAVLQVSVMEWLPGELEPTQGVLLLLLEVLGAELGPLLLGDLEAGDGERLAGGAVAVGLQTRHQLPQLIVLLGVWDLE